ncbi:MAG TPA: YidB family protein [Xanthobacteraceae bacterium]
MGLLDSIFGGGAQQSGRGGASPLTLGLLALLAYRTYQGKGRLADMLGRGNDADGLGRTAGPGRLPDGNPAGPLGGTGGGGLGDLLGGLLGGGAGSRPMGGAGASGGGLGDLLRGGLGGLLGGAAAGGLLNGGLGDLMRRFQDNGYGDTAQSWIGRGPNREIAPHELESAVGRDTLQELSEQSGRPYDEVLSELSESLPNTVDQLTPEGRMPSDDEASRWV